MYYFKVQPPLNLLDKLRFALKQGPNEIVLTTLWIIEYLYQVDQISLSTVFHQNILTWLYSLCAVSSVTTGSVLLLRLQFNCLIEHMNIAPHTLFDNSTKSVDKSNFHVTRYF